MSETTNAAASDLALPLSPGVWTIDPAHSNVTFAIRHIGISKVRGRFNAFDATLDVGTGLDDTLVQAVIDIASIDTGNADRDGHVLSPELLDVERRPQLRFASTRITGEGEDWRLEGEATLGDVTRPFAFDVEFGGLQDFMGTPHAGFSAAGELRRSDFGVNFSGPAELGLGKVLKFELELQFQPPAA
jgi:polyisoprenoid-binding protein YceI